MWFADFAYSIVLSHAVCAYVCVCVCVSYEYA